MSELTERDCLSPQAQSEALATLPGWKIDEAGARLVRTFVFEDFGSAFSFMTHVALKAEAINHHPEWSNVWSRVDIALTTHTAGGVTRKDVALAQAIDDIGSRFDLSCAIDADGECGGCQ